MFPNAAEYLLVAGLRSRTRIQLRSYAEEWSLTSARATDSHRERLPDNNCCTVTFKKCVYSLTIVVRIIASNADSRLVQERPNGISSNYVILCNENARQGIKISASVFDSRFIDREWENERGITSRSREESSFDSERWSNAALIGLSSLPDEYPWRFSGECTICVFCFFHAHTYSTSDTVSKVALLLPTRWHIVYVFVICRLGTIEIVA